MYNCKNKSTVVGSYGSDGNGQKEERSEIELVNERKKKERRRRIKFLEGESND